MASALYSLICDRATSDSWRERERKRANNEPRFIAEEITKICKAVRSSSEGCGAFRYLVWLAWHSTAQHSIGECCLCTFGGIEYPALPAARQRQSNRRRVAQHMFGAFAYRSRSRSLCGARGPFAYQDIRHLHRPPPFCTRMYRGIGMRMGNIGESHSALIQNNELRDDVSLMPLSAEHPRPITPFVSLYLPWK